MRKSYLFVYNSGVGSREGVKKYLDSLPQIINWRHSLPNSFYLVSELSADEISNLILEFTKKKGLFVITEFTSSTQGWLTEKSWAMINKKLDPSQLEKEFPIKQ